MKLDVLPSPPPWYAGGLSFTCTCCGNCCTGAPGFVWISDEEVDRLAEHLGLSRHETLERYCRKIGQRISLKERRTQEGNYDCIFLTELPPEIKTSGQVAHPRRVCGIYAVRPLQCRTWPFWEGNLASQNNWNSAATRCPGMNRGRRYAQEKIEALREAKDWPDRPPTSSARSRDLPV
jgi:Fe-S-cluster containining protein